MVYVRIVYNQPIEMECFLIMQLWHMQFTCKCCIYKDLYSKTFYLE